MVFNRSAAESAVALLPSPRDGGAFPAGWQVAEPVHERPRWQRRFAVQLAAGDTLLAAATTAATTALAGRLDGVPQALLLVSSLALVAAWPTVVALTGAYSPRVLGTGSDEYRRIGRAGLLLLAATALVSYAARLDLPRSLVIIGIPLAALTTLVGRSLARRRLRAAWAAGRRTRRTVLVGRDSAVLQLAERLDRERFAGLQVVAACVTQPAWSRVAATRGLPVAGLSE